MAEGLEVSDHAGIIKVVLENPGHLKKKNNCE